MAQALLTIDLDAVARNWRALDAASGTATETAAVLKADAYGLGAARVAPALARAGARTFFVALAEEGAALRRILGPGPRILVLSGLMAGDAGLVRDAALVPMLVSEAQVARHRADCPDAPFGVQIDTGMNRLGLGEADWRRMAGAVLAWKPVLLTSHLASADDPDAAMNADQLALFGALTDGTGVPRSLAATGGTLLGLAYQFDMTRPGIGLYGGAPFADAAPVVRLDLPVLQVRDVEPGGTVGYGAIWRAGRRSRIATISSGYADGLIRALSNGAQLFDNASPCPVVGRVSMDLLAVDVTDLAADPETLAILGPEQGIDALAAAAGTIGYEILTSLGPRYARRYLGAAA